MFELSQGDSHIHL